MHRPLLLVLAVVLWAGQLPAGQNRTSWCEAFSSGFTTPDKHRWLWFGPFPDQPVVEGIADDWPDGEIGPGAGIEF